MQKHRKNTNPCLYILYLFDKSMTNNERNFWELSETCYQVYDHNEKSTENTPFIF